jgi:hypothetical protein
MPHHRPTSKTQNEYFDTGALDWLALCTPDPILAARLVAAIETWSVEVAAITE